jgi:AraC-like DNA-binding protein
MLCHPWVSTMLTAPERPRVDAAGTDHYAAVHRDTIDEVIRDLRDRRAAAVLVSVARCSRADAARVVTRMGSIVRDFPRVRAVALLTDADGDSPATVLALGLCGIRTLIDARHAAGWGALRDVLSERADTASHLEGRAIARLADDLRHAPPDCQRFFTTLFTVPARVATVQALAAVLQVAPTTLVSRFARERLPSPKVYLAVARLARAAALLEDPAASIASAATCLEYSSRQSFGRHLRLRLGLTPTDFRLAFDGERMIQYFRRALVLSHLSQLRGFSPLSPPSLRQARPVSRQ